jgi:sugar lactone lactonase YvrE
MIKFSGILLFVSYSLFAQPPKPEVAFIVPEKDLIPEGIAYDPADKTCYLGSIYKKKVVRITAKGDISDFNANSQVHQINSGRGQINDPDSLKDVVVMKIKLN